MKINPDSAQPLESRDRLDLVVPADKTAETQKVTTVGPVHKEQPVTELREIQPDVRIASLMGDQYLAAQIIRSQLHAAVSQSAVRPSGPEEQGMGGDPTQEATESSKSEIQSQRTEQVKQLTSGLLKAQLDTMMSVVRKKG